MTLYVRIVSLVLCCCVITVSLCCYRQQWAYGMQERTIWALDSTGEHGPSSEAVLKLVKERNFACQIMFHVILLMFE